MMRRGIILSLTIGSGLLIGACGGSGRTGPRTTPPRAMPERLVLVAQNFEDTNANRYRDTAVVYAYVYADSTRFPLPVEADGEFEFRLEDATGTTVAAWRFDHQQTRAARRRLGPGPGFVFTLSLLVEGNDRLTATEADLVAAFSSPGGRTVYARTSAPVLIGPVNRSDLP